VFTIARCIVSTTEGNSFFPQTSDEKINMKIMKSLSEQALKTIKLLTLASCGAALLIGVNANAQIANGKSKFLGNIIANDVPGNFSTYWNQVTPENGTKWGEVEGTRNQMNWVAADKAYNFARANGYKFKFHTFVWGSQEPGWLGGLSNADKKAELEQYMQLACQRFSPDMIDVVNEPLHAPSNMRDAIGGAGATGWDWVIWSFQKARQYCPNAKLHLNDYGIINDSNAIGNYKVIIKLLKDRGLIDGVGMQNHLFNIDDLDPNLMRQNLALLVQAGVPIYSTEWDMSGDDAQQLARYKAKFPIVWESPNVAGVTLWGYREGATWRSGTHLIRADGSERPAMTWLKNYIQGTTNTSAPASSKASSSRVTTTSSARSSVASSKVASSKAASSRSSTSGGTTKCQQIVTNEWNTGYTANIRITNTGSSMVSSWSLSWRYADATRITNSWNGNVTGSNPYSANNLSWNSNIAPGQYVEFGFQATKGGATSTAPTFGGASCN
jgi:endo-1,4-beta-xylanase